MSTIASFSQLFRPGVSLGEPASVRSTVTNDAVTALKGGSKTVLAPSLLHDAGALFRPEEAFGAERLRLPPPGDAGPSPTELKAAFGRLVALQPAVAGDSEVGAMLTLCAQLDQASQRLQARAQLGG